MSRFQNHKNLHIFYFSTFAQEGLEMPHKNEFFNFTSFCQVILTMVQVPLQVPCQRKFYFSRYCRKCCWPNEFHFLSHFWLWHKYRHTRKEKIYIKTFTWIWSDFRGHVQFSKNYHQGFKVPDILKDLKTKLKHFAPSRIN